MTIIAFNRYWVIRWPWLLVNLFALMLLLGLSYWQWQRAEEKTKTLNRIAESQQQVVTNIAGLLTKQPVERDGLKMDFNARWISPIVWLIDNRVVNGRIGYDVVIAVTDVEPTNNSTPLLVNLGWVAAPNDRSSLPLITIPEQLRIQGIFRTQTKGILLGDNIENKDAWPMRIQQVDTAQLEEFLTQSLVEGVLYQEADSPFQIHYRPVVLPPERHKAYAVQWFLLAIALVVVGVIASSHKYSEGMKQ